MKYIFSRPQATCTFDVDRWMSSNRLKLNPGKIEFIWLGLRQQLAPLQALSLKDQLVAPQDKVRDLGVILDSRLEAHVASVSCCYFHQLW